MRLAALQLVAHARAQRANRDAGHFGSPVMVYKALLVGGSSLEVHWKSTDSAVQKYRFLRVSRLTYSTYIDIRLYTKQ